MSEKQKVKIYKIRGQFKDMEFIKDFQFDDTLLNELNKLLRQKTDCSPIHQERVTTISSNACSFIAIYQYED